jgi:putative ABC transport system permease protein
MIRHVRRAVLRFLGLFKNSRPEAEMEREISAHLALLEDDFESKGLSREEARLAARRAYGGVEQAKQLHRNERTYQGPAQTAQDIRYGFRQLLRAPGFTIPAVLTLALGIGANTAIFSVVNAVLVKPLSYPDPDRIVQFSLTFPGGPVPGASIPDFRLWREQTGAFRHVSAYDVGSQVMNLTSGLPKQIHGLHVTSDYFRLLGARVQLGRTFIDGEDRPNAGSYVVISYALWSRTFGADANIVGKAISLGNEPFTVVGVTSQSFHAEPDVDVWLPFQFDLNSSDQTHYFFVAGRLNPGITLEQANAELKVAANEARRTSPQADPNLGYIVQPLRDTMVSGARSSLIVLGAAVCFVLLIACANVANLLLARATARNREFAIRVALGAGRRRIFRQLLTESIMLSCSGGLLGLGLGIVGVDALLSRIPVDIPRIGESGANVSFDGRVLLFTVGLTLLTGIGFGIVPALGAARPDVNSVLKESGFQQSAGSHRNKVRSLLVISEVSLAIVLLIGAALLIRTFMALRGVNPGFDSHNVLVVDMSLAGARFSNTAAVSRLVRDGCQRINAIPGVLACAETSWPPLKGKMGLPFTVTGRPSRNGASTGDGLWMEASPGYFQVLRIPVLRGRDFTEGDTAASPRVVLINETMATRYWPDQNPIGQQITIGGDIGPKFKEPPREIIGVIGDTRDFRLDALPEPTMFIPEAQESDGLTGFSLQFGPVVWLIRTQLEPYQLVPLVREQLRQASGGLPVGNIRTMGDMLSKSTARQDFYTLLLSVLAGAALVLAAIGIYGVLAYLVTQRTQEIGIRMALGADRANIRGWVLKQGLLLTGSGVLIGVCAAFGLTRLIASFLFGVNPWDPLVFVTVPLLLTVAAIIAIWVPAQRASGLDPIRSLRTE